MVIAIPVATDDDVREFRRIRSEQGGVRLEREKNALVRSLARLNRRLGRPWQLRWSVDRAVRSAFRGVSRSGAAVAAEHGVGIAKQFLQILATSARTGMGDKEYYLYQMYLPDRWPSRFRQFPNISHSLPALDWLVQARRSPDAEHMRNKRLFAARCQEAGLPTVRVLAEFVDGESPVDLALPKRDLFSKPTNESCGIGAEAWRYDQAKDCFIDAAGERQFSSGALRQYLSDLSRLRPTLLQERLTNHPDLLPLTNGALSTLRLVTCIAPSGAIDLMPAVIRLPAGAAVVDNFAQGGLSAPVDLARGVISGPAAQKNDALGVRWLDKHPDSGQELVGFAIPGWAEALELACRAHRSFPTLPFAGWDIAVLQDGPLLVEGNSLFDSDLTIVPHRLCLSDTQFIPYYNYHWHQATNAQAA